MIMEDDVYNRIKETKNSTSGPVSQLDSLMSKKNSIEEAQQSPLIDKEVHQSPLVDKEVPQTPLVDKEVPQTPLVNKDVHQTPLVDQEVPQTPLVDKEVSMFNPMAAASPTRKSSR